MRQKLILHIGTHKTGSTTIQNYLYFNRLWLKFWGVYYPRPINGRVFFTSNHRDLRDTALTEGKRRAPHIHPEFGSHDALLGRYLGAMKQVNRPINILSCEGWSSHLNRYARRLAPLSQHFDVKVIALFRRPDLWVEKFYNQRIANVEHAETRTFDSFVGQRHMETYLFDRHRLFSWWANAFGPENVEIIPYEPAVQSFDLIRQFLQACEIKGGAHRLLLRRARANKTLSSEQTEALRKRIEAGEVIEAPELRDLKRKQSPSSSYLSATARERLLERASPDMQKICEDFVRDGRKSMFPTVPEQISSSERSD